MQLNEIFHVWYSLEAHVSNQLLAWRIINGWRLAGHIGWQCRGWRNAGWLAGSLANGWLKRLNAAKWHPVCTNVIGWPASPSPCSLASMCSPSLSVIQLSAAGHITSNLYAAKKLSWRYPQWRITMLAMTQALALIRPLRYQLMAIQWLSMWK